VKFKIDENLPVERVADLNLAGHKADTVLDENLTGATDSIVVAAALREGSILLTLDKGIANLIQHPVNTHAGVVFFRPRASGRPSAPDFIRSRG
jgi:predicted nuclease of predicted toxin-antitoxin system